MGSVLTELDWMIAIAIASAIAALAIRDVINRFRDIQKREQLTREQRMAAEGITEEDCHETLYEHERTRRPEER